MCEGEVQPKRKRPVVKKREPSIIWGEEGDVSMQDLVWGFVGNGIKVEYECLAAEGEVEFGYVRVEDVLPGRVCCYWLRSDGCRICCCWCC